MQKVDLSSRPFKVWVGEDDHALHLAQAVIIATGARANYIGLESEHLLKNKGVSASAVCDGPLYRGKEVVVVGVGDTAMEEAAYLAAMCANVTLVHRCQEFHASKAMQQRVVAHPKIRILRNHVVTEVLDVVEQRVTGVRVQNVESGDFHVLNAGALFVAIGHTPMTELFKGQLAMHDHGYLRGDPGTTRTSVPGVFAAGGRRGLGLSPGSDCSRHKLHGGARR